MTGPERKKREGCPFCAVAIAVAFMVVGYAVALYVAFGRFHG